MLRRCLLVAGLALGGAAPAAHAAPLTPPPAPAQPHARRAQAGPPPGSQKLPQGGAARPAHAAPLTPARPLAELTAGRAQAGLPAVSQMLPEWNDACHAHDLYMAQNGFGHTETQGLPGYSAAGDEAGRASDLFYVSGGAAAGPRIFD